jgi:phenylalanyl-tRNA synthetase alpha chain
VSADIEHIYKEAIAAIEQADTDGLRAAEVEYLGRKGKLTQLLRTLGELEPARRAATGRRLNEVKAELETAIASRRAMLGNSTDSAGWVDMTEPPREAYLLPVGHIHPVSQVLEEIENVFLSMGYEIADGPEVETDWYNFEALNIPPQHPARDMQDTFYLEGGQVLRTHTSGVQVRYMKDHKPPIRIIAPGKVYRNENEDASHSWSFHQVEGLVVDTDTTLADLHGTLLAMMRGVLGEKTEVRLRPSFFPYTEPSVEMDATCPRCGGEGCVVCAGTGWLEMGGAGMVHPQVLRNVGLDPRQYQGFAFGFGPERIAMIKYDINDVREFWRPRISFLEQF